MTTFRRALEDLQAEMEPHGFVLCAAREQIGGLCEATFVCAATRTLMDFRWNTEGASGGEFRALAPFTLEHDVN